MKLDDLKSNIKAHYDFSQVSLLDQSGNGNDLTMSVGTGSPQWTGTKYGRALKLSAGTNLLTALDSASLQITGDMSIMVFGEFPERGDMRFVSKRDAGGTNYDFGLTATQIFLYDGVSSSNFTIDTRNSNFIGMSFSSGIKPRFFVDNQFVGEGSFILNITADDAALVIGNIFVGTTPSTNIVNDIYIFDKALTDEEMVKASVELQEKIRVQGLAKRNFDYTVGVNESATNQWRMDRGYVNVKDDVGGKDLTALGDVIPGQNETKLVAGKWSHPDDPDLDVGTGDFTILFDGYADNVGTQREIFYKSAGGVGYIFYIQADKTLGMTVGNLTGASSANDLRDVGALARLKGGLAVDRATNTCRFFINGVGGDTFDISNIGATTLDNASLLYIGGSSSPSDFFTGAFRNVIFVKGEAKDEAWFAQEYKNSDILLYQETFEDVPVTLGTSSDHFDDYQVISGTWKTSQESSGQKWRECVTNGEIGVPISSGAGTIQFDLYKNASSSEFLILFFAEALASVTASVQNGYGLHFNSGNIFFAIEMTNGVYGSKGNVSGYGINGVKYTIRVTVSAGNTLNYYILGGTFTDWTHMPTLTFTDTSVTKSNAFMISARTGDKVTNPRIWDTVIDPTI